MTTRAAIGAGLAGLPEEVDLLVAGLGATGAGVALDAATRGLRVLAVDSHDLAHGTSRFSSKLVHGGLRYLAHGQLGIAHESAVERGILMERTAPHLARPVPMLIPLHDTIGRPAQRVARVGLAAGDLLRRAARTSTDTLPTPRKVSAAEALALAPGLRRDTLRGALLGWDGQLVDDARLVITVARTAAAHGALIRTQVRATGRSGTTVELTDPRTGDRRQVRARAFVNATGAWAAALTPGLRLRPSRGTHLVLRPEALPGLRAVVTVPIAGSASRYALVLPQGDGRVLVGLTDVPHDGEPPEVATPEPAEIDELLDVVAPAFQRPPEPADVAGAFAGLRPLLAGGGATADLSRRHAVLTDGTTVTVVGGKLTTYRRMAQDAVDAAVDAARLSAGPCRTATLPLAGAATRAALAGSTAPAPLVARYGADAELVLATAQEATGWSTAQLLDPVADGLSTCLAELVFGVVAEGAADVGDLLDRRTRIGLVAADRERALPAAARVLHTLGQKELAVER